MEPSRDIKDIQRMLIHEANAAFMSDAVRGSGPSSGFLTGFYVGLIAAEKADPDWIRTVKESLDPAGRGSHDESATRIVAGFAASESSFEEASAKAKAAFTRKFKKRR